MHAAPIPSAPLPTLVGMDIYLIDLIMKGYYQPGQHILDAGAGSGRNLNWFIDQGFDLSACDFDPESEEMFREHWPDFKGEWTLCDLAQMPHSDEHFDHANLNSKFYNFNQSNFEEVYIFECQKSQSQWSLAQILFV